MTANSLYLNSEAETVGVCCTPAHTHILGVAAPFQGTGVGPDPPLFLGKDMMSLFPKILSFWWGCPCIGHFSSTYCSRLCSDTFLSHASLSPPRGPECAVPCGQTAVQFAHYARSLLKGYHGQKAFLSYSNKSSSSFPVLKTARPLSK